MLLYAITDRRIFNAGGSSGSALRTVYRSWLEAGVDFVQLREKDLDAPALKALAEEITAGMKRRHSKLLINIAVLIAVPAFLDLAIELEADGVHIAGPPSVAAAAEVRRIFGARGREAIISMPCRSLEEIATARIAGADLMLYSPVFEKKSPGNGEKVPGTQGTGIEMLRKICAAAKPATVIALGGITAENASECISAGAAGVAGIRLFAGEDWRKLLP